MDSVEDPPFVATWMKYIVLSRYIAELPIRQKRLAFWCMRQFAWANADMFFPSLGITAGEFCTFHALGQEQPRRNNDIQPAS